MNKSQDEAKASGDEMTQSIRDAAQALLDAIDSRLNDVVPYEQVAGLRAALSAPQPTADERAADHMRLVAAAMRYSGAADDFATEDTYAAVEQSARALLSASQEDAEHAAMYRWLRDNKCNSMHLTRNGDHACNYMTASQWIDENPDWFDGTSKEELEKMKETNTIWDLQIYPNTPVGFNVWRAATLDAAIRAAMSAKETK